MAAAADIVQRSVPITVTGTGTSVVQTKTAGVIEGDLMVQFVMWTATGGITFTPDAGWTEDTGSAVDWLGGALSTRAYWRIATDADLGTASWTGTLSSSTPFRSTMCAYTNVVQSSPIDGRSVGSGSSSTPSVSGYTTTVDNVMLVNYVAAGPGITFTPPSGFTERLDASAVSINDKVQAVAGATGTIAGTLSSSDDWCSIVIGLSKNTTATRIYVDGVHLGTLGLPVGTVNSVWNDTGGSTPRRLNRAKGTSAYNSYSRAEAVSTDNYDVLLVRSRIGPLAAQTLTGHFKAQMKASESSTDLNGIAQIAIKILTPAAADRGVAYAGHSSTGTDSEFSTTLTNRSFPSPVISRHLTDVGIIEGDYLLVEWGYRAQNTTATSMSGALRSGESGSSDMPEDETTTADNAPWIQFDFGLLLIEETLLDKYKYQYQRRHE